jgi:hypothetical protein
MRSLNDFKANLDKFGTVKQNRFDVILPNESVNLSFRCESLNIPGIQILTTDFHLYGGEPILKIPNGRANDEVQMSFLAMGDMRDKYWFEEWLHKISNFENNNVAYYDDVAKDIWINVYNESPNPKPTDAVVTPIDVDGPAQRIIFEGGIDTLKQIYIAKLRKAIPTRVEMIQVSWADTDQLMKYTVNFSYESLKIESYANRTGKSFQHLDKEQK